MNMQSITSKDNPALKTLRALATQARARREAGRTVLDGVHLIESALAAGVLPETLWFAESALARPEIDALAQRASALPQRLLSDPLFRSAAPTDSPSGVMAVITPPESVAPNTSGTVLVLDGVQDAGNVGTLLRTAAAAAVDQVWLTPGCAQAWSPRVLRAGMGAHFGVSIAEGVDALACLENVNTPVLATSLEATDTLFEADLRGLAIWLFGAEGQGVSAPLLARATQRLFIPMPGKVESLNVAAAAAICLFEQVRQRQGM